MSATSGMNGWLLGHDVAVSYSTLNSYVYEAKSAKVPLIKGHVSI